MAGHAVELAGKTHFEGTNLQASATQLIAVAEHVPVVGARELDLLVRLHTETIGATQKVEVLLVGDGYTLGDPSLSFLTSSALVTVTWDQSTTAPGFQIGTVSSGFGSMVSVYVQLTQDQTPATLEAELSIDLVMKE
jgi:hypothetical protein